MAAIRQLSSTRCSSSGWIVEMRKISQMTLVMSTPCSDVPV
jgi:hypothetical protein